mmetsp:Transcript_16307/g.31640  ORF Transcript_16307/g.31640 Transcript_16307/m.31640 type:complete len:346 (+) Transcript_16307:154-1191(+)
MAHVPDGDDANPFAAASGFDDVNLTSVGATRSGGQSAGAAMSALNDPSVQQQLHIEEDHFLDFQHDQNSGSSSIVDPSHVSVGNARVEPMEMSGRMGPAETDNLPPVPTGFLAPLKVEYYMPYFNVVTQDIIDRMQRVATPWKNDFFETLDNRPDLYAPFWVCATLVFLIASMSNLASWIDHDSSSGVEWQHDFKVLGLGASFVFGFALAMPFVAWGCFTYLGVSTANISFTELACVYGYSIAPFLVACVICMVPDLEWPAVIIALIWSTVFLLRNLWSRLGRSENGYLPPMAPEADQSQDDATSLMMGDEPQQRKLAAVLLAGVIGLHIVFAVVLKVKFFGRSQ